MITTLLLHTLNEFSSLSLSDAHFIGRYCWMRKFPPQQQLRIFYEPVDCQLRQLKKEREINKLSSSHTGFYCCKNWYGNGGTRTIKWFQYRLMQNSRLLPLPRALLAHKQWKSFHSHSLSWKTRLTWPCHALFFLHLPLKKLSSAHALQEAHCRFIL